MTKNTKVVCPVCGAEIAIAENEHVTVGIAIGKDSGLGTVELQLANDGKKKSKAQLRIEAMKAAGMDVSNLFCIKDEYGKEVMVGKKDDNGDVTILSDNDPVIQKIMDAGSLRNAHLFKQHVLAKILKMMVRYEYNFENHVFVPKYDWKGNLDMSNYTKCINSLGYKYAWQVVLDELKRQAAMYRHGDMKALKEDSRWYNQALVLAMVDHHHRLLTELTESLRTHNYQGVPYISLRGTGNLIVNKQSAYGYVYLYEIDRLLSSHSGFRSSIAKASNPIQLYLAVQRYVNIATPGNLSYCKSELKPGVKEIKIEAIEAWKSAYKGYGGYFAMQNLIMFHGCNIFIPTVGDGGVVVPVKLSKEDSIKQLDKWAEEYKYEGYWLIGALKQLIIDNHFDVVGKQKEWYEAKRNS